MTYQFSRKPKVVPLIKTEHRHINSVIPDPYTQEVFARLNAVEPPTMYDNQLRVIWDRAHDFNVWDTYSNQFIDFTSGIFVANVGHANEIVMSAVDLADCLHAYAFPTAIRVEYLEALTKWSGFEKAILHSSGTEATECALKLMRLHGRKIGKRKGGIVCFDGAFHGRTMGAEMMCGNEKNKSWIGYKDPYVHHMPFPYPWQCRNAGQFFRDAIGILAETIDPTREICGFMLETFQGWCAAFYPSEFVQAIERFCRRHNILLCFDEMQSGFARTGRKFGYEHYGVTPDLICVGKAMGGGVPLSGVLGRAEILDAPDAGDLSSTHSANPICCAAGLAVLNEIDRLDLVREAERKGLILYTELEKLTQRFTDKISCVLGNGLIAAVLFNGPHEFVSRVVERCYQKGLLLIHTGRESIKIGPPLTIADDALIEGVQVIGEAISEMAIAR